METSESRSRKKLEGSINKEVTKMFEAILDYTQVACPNKEAFQVLRSRILRCGNDCIRNLCVNLDFYNIKYEGRTEDIVEVITRKKSKL